MSDTTSKSWSDLGRWAKRRRIELDMTQADVDAAGGPSVGVVSKIENAKQDFYEDRVFADLERALKWQPGSSAAILAGGEPTPIRDAGGLPPLKAQARGVVAEPEGGRDSSVTADVRALLQLANDRLAELTEKVDRQSEKLDDQHRQIAELRREQQRKGA